MPEAHILLVFAAAGGQVRGWTILSDSDAGADAVIAAAKPYKINHLQLSHEIVHDLREVREPAKQAQANRLNALGERLTRIGKLGDGEFDFNQPVGVGGPGPVQDMPARGLREGMDAVETQLRASGGQLSVLDALLFDQELERNAMPSRAPVANSFITSGYGHRADPFGGGGQFHRGIDFDAQVGDPVMTVADGVVSYSDWRSGYGNVVEVDHGNGFVTRYAHNSRNTVKVGDLVRVGQEVAKAGSTGRSTGAHVHFEVWENGRVHNPRKFLGEIGVKRQ
jgi:murein DD-endopeptidase MepM/ murein hydrolase activator NlpD